MERYLGVNLLGPGPCLMKKNLPGRGLTKFEKHWSRLGYEKNQLDVTGIDVYSCNVNSTCFEHHYAHHQEYRLYINCVW